MTRGNPTNPPSADKSWLRTGILFVLVLLIGAAVWSATLEQASGRMIATPTVPPMTLAVLEGDWQGLPTSLSTPILADTYPLPVDDLPRANIDGLLVTRDLLVEAQHNPTLTQALRGALERAIVLAVWEGTTGDLHQTFGDVQMTFASSGGIHPRAYAYVVLIGDVSASGEVELDARSDRTPAPDFDVNFMRRTLWAAREHLWQNINAP